jgi:hypothetical protein
MTKRVRLPLLALMTISFVLPPSASKAEERSVPKPLVLPLSGVGNAGLTFNGTVAVHRFVQQDGEMFAIGAVSGSLSGPAGPIGTSISLPVMFPVHVGDGPTARAERRFIDPASLSAPDYGARVILAQATTCGVLHLALGAVNLKRARFCGSDDASDHRHQRRHRRTTWKPRVYGPRHGEQCRRAGEVVEFDSRASDWFVGWCDRRTGRLTSPRPNGGDAPPSERRF